MTRLVTIASVLVALAPLAAAQPRDYDEQHRRDTDRDRDHDRGRVNRHDWVTLGAGGIERGGEKYMVGANTGEFHELRIEATRGTPLLRRVEVRFLDDSLQTIDVGRRMQTGEEIDADLTCRDCRISSITVVGRPDRYSHVAIAAR